MHLLKLNTILDITSTHLVDIAHQIGDGFTEGLNPIEWKLIPKADIMEELFYDLSDNIREAKDALSNLSDAMDTIEETLNS